MREVEDRFCWRNSDAASSPAFCLHVRHDGLSVGASLASHQEDASDEYRVKALFLYNFAKFVEWPNSIPSDGICIGVFEEDPFWRSSDANHRREDRQWPRVLHQASQARRRACPNRAARS